MRDNSPLTVIAGLATLNTLTTHSDSELAYSVHAHPSHHLPIVT
jgi:hypothetical protein